MVDIHQGVRIKPLIIGQKDELTYFCTLDTFSENVLYKDIYQFLKNVSYPEITSKNDKAM